MKNTEGFNSSITFLNVNNFGLSPAAFTPKNLKYFEKLFELFLFPLLIFLLINNLILFLNFVISFVGFSAVVPDSLLHYENPTQIHLYLNSSLHDYTNMSLL